MKKNFLFLVLSCSLFGCSASDNKMESQSSVSLTCYREGNAQTNYYTIKAPSEDEEIEEMIVKMPVSFEHIFTHLQFDTSGYTSEQLKQIILDNEEFFKDLYNQIFEISTEDISIEVHDDFYFVTLHVYDVPAFRETFGQNLLNDTLLFGPFVEYIQSNGLTCQ